eukprot:s87_g24.t1
MHDLCGLDVALTRLDHEKQTALDLARIRALQCGAFGSAAGSTLGLVSKLDRAAWAVVNASTNQSISYGCVSGILQTIGRAELGTIISAIAWATLHGVSVVIWTDSASTCRKAISWHGENHDLWQRLAEELSHAFPAQIDIQWTPSHVDTALCETLGEEFLATWNHVADAHAVSANQQRGPAFDQLAAEAEAYYHTWQKRLRALRSFYLKVAQTRTEQIDVIDLTADAEVEIHSVADLSLGDALPIDWQRQLRLLSDTNTLSTEFVLFLVSTFVSIEPVQNHFVVISFIELTLWCVQTLRAQFPTEKTTAVSGVSKL